MRVLKDYQQFGETQPERKNNLTLGLMLLIVGLGIGAVTALLYAPESGQKTRRKLRRRYEDARETVGEWGEHAGELWEKGSEWAGDTREKLADRVRPMRKGWR